MDRIRDRRPAPRAAVGVIILFVGLCSAPSPARAALMVPAYSSLPGAHAKIYLDFGGTTYPGTWGGRAPGTVPAYDINGNVNDFSDSELASIREIHLRVAEKYSPFNIDVTTVDPGNLTNGETARLIIGGDGAWRNTDPAAGVAFLNAFTDSDVNVGWVFPTYTGGGHPRITAEVAAHEAGHMFGLQHQSDWAIVNGDWEKTREYSNNNNSPTRRPVMGESYHSTRGLWWHGTPATSPTVLQDDLAVLTKPANGFGYRADDHADALAGATRLVPDSAGRVAGAGVITQTSDMDLFSFVTGTGTIRFTTALAEFGGMLDSTLRLFAADGRLLQTNATNNLTETLVASLFAGEYFVGVASRGNYADIGQYRLSGQIIPVAVPEPAGAVALAGIAGLGLLTRRRASRRDAVRERAQ